LLTTWPDESDGMARHAHRSRKIGHLGATGGARRSRSGVLYGIVVSNEKSRNDGPANSEVVRYTSRLTESRGVLPLEHDVFAHA
jgi:hypothetical protein